MKGLFKKLGLCVLAGSAVVGLVACGDEGDKPTPTPDPVETEADVKKAKDEALKSLQAKFDALNQNNYDEQALDDFKTIVNYGELFVNGAETVAQVKSNLNIIVKQFDEYKSSVVPLANGVYSYVAASYEDRAKILGVLEKYAIANGLTGITVFEDGGYALYKPYLKKGTENYIPGYGFGLKTEGDITEDLPGETNPDWARYFHEFETNDPAKIYYGDDKGSVVGDLTGYIFGGYYGNFMNETKDGYEWVCDLAKSKPIPLNKSEKTGLASKYRIEVKVGDDLKYNTLTQVEALKAYNNRPVELEDYITPYKLLHTQAYGFARGGENLDEGSTFKGISAYYNKSQDGYNDEAWKSVALKGVVEDGKSYLEFEFNQPCSEFYAMYYTSSAMYAPIPESFLQLIGHTYWGKFDTSKGYTPVDTTLSTGPYTLERWDNNKQIVFKKNPNTDDKVHYQIKGIHVNILPAATSDPEAAFNEYMADKLHAVGIPSTKLKEYRDHKDARRTVATTTTKLNVNTCTQDEWEDLFGVNGSVTQTARADYWECEPALSNEDFIKALSYSINRKEFAENVGRTPSAAYFGTGYMADPEEGISYNSTEYHKDAIAALLTGTDGYGYSLELARAYFKKAAEALLEAGVYSSGDTITLEIAWQGAANVTVYHNPIKEYWETAFNHESVCNNQLKLEVVDWVPEGGVWSDVYYKKMMVGKFDLGFGGINGNPLNPLNFLEVLKSDNSSTFTLNWGPDTSKVDETLVWEGQVWSFDSLWQATETGGYYEKGKLVANHSCELVSATKNDDGSMTYVIDANTIKGVDDVKIVATGAVLFSYFPANNSQGYAYAEDKIEDFAYDEEKDLVTVTVSKALCDKYVGSLAASGFPIGIDVLFSNTILDIESSSLDSVAIEPIE